MRSTGFEALPVSTDSIQPHPIIVGEPQKWAWIITPKTDKEDTEQVVVFNSYIRDLTTGKLVADSPYATVTMRIRTPLGLPTWLVSSQTGVGAILGGFAAMIIPWLLNEISELKKKEKSKILLP